MEKARSGVLQVPILIYNGKQDVFDWAADEPHADMRGAMEFFDVVGAKNKRVKFMIINDAGHFVSREQPEQFNADLIQFTEYWKNTPKILGGLWPTFTTTRECPCARTASRRRTIERVAE